ncbi:hypothetical protein ST20ES_96 [Mycobacterium phage 20ES]|nr:hypothetical protein First_0095 [Mycobacterium phage First]YP_009009142.1 hypothetical protein ST20ES_96 [Mycobacterium phage 20ES]YP_009009833.1 hypothetical protein CRB1_94 [Mycobacterium phage CRB1]AFV51226.1 hypothetical protein First_0095 [Mycobacterium phage First]AHJ86549.1 hypothetical protein 20ES_96 [Mycobacterium phage 20ES]AHJ86705.1 hypothetical protein CRB1_94 [Mycobacterium phage CRB1]
MNTERKIYIASIGKWVYCRGNSVYTR